MAVLTNKVAIVTGAASGIGAATAERLAQDGFAVVVNYRGDEGPAQDVTRKIQASGGQAHPLRADVSDAAAVRRMFDEAESWLGGVDVLINSAGVMELSNIADTDDAAFDRMIDANLRGTFNTLREAAKRLRPNGRIINISSSVVGLYQPQYAVYAATKSAIEALTHVLSKELGARGITVNAVAPGPVGTEFFRKGKSEELIAHIASLNPLGRLGRPDDVASTIAFLAGPDGGWVNGQVLRTNGGAIYYGADPNRRGT